MSGRNADLHNLIAGLYAAASDTVVPRHGMVDGVVDLLGALGGRGLLHGGSRLMTPPRPASARAPPAPEHPNE